MRQQTKRFVLIFAATISPVAAVGASFVLLPQGIGQLTTVQLGAMVGLCILPGLTALAMSMDNSQRASKAAREGGR